MISKPALLCIRLIKDQRSSGSHSERLWVVEKVQPVTLWIVSKALAMRSLVVLMLVCLGALFFPLACVDPQDLILRGTVDILVVDGTITNLAEPQSIRLNRSRADRLTGRFGTLPITKATVEIVVDSAQVISCPETTDGRYELPSNFKGQVGHAYQLRFTLSDGTAYASSQQVMLAVPPVSSVSAQFNPQSLPPQQFAGYTAGHDIFVDSQDPADQHNYYRWEWTLYERQYWCKTCQKGVYTVYKVLPGQTKDFEYFVTGRELYEDCFTPKPTTDGQITDGTPPVPDGDWYYDYRCQTSCWEILRGNDIVIFDDKYINGGAIARQPVAHIPYYTYEPALVDVRQSSLTADAYRYYKLFQDQTQNTGGLADTPPTLPRGNVQQVGNRETAVVGYFTVSAVSLYHHWLDRKDTQGVPYGALDPSGPHNEPGDDLFFALNRRRPFPEPSPPYIGSRPRPKIMIWPNADRPPVVPCYLSDQKTPYKPEGWRD